MVVTFRTAFAAVSLLLALPAAHAAVVPINEVQGDGMASPLAGQTVTVDGVITGRTADGLFLQSLPSNDDGDPATSEGLFIHTGSPPDEDFFVGDRIRATGTVQEYLPRVDVLPLTRLSGAPVLERVQLGVPLPAPVPLVGSDIPADPALDFFERWEGMRVAPTIQAVGPSGGGFHWRTGAARYDGIFHASIGGDGYPVREAGIGVLDPQSIPAGKTPAIWDQNPEVLRVDSTALGAPVIEAWRGRVWFSIASVMHYAEGRYTLLVEPGNPNPAGGAPGPSGNQPGFPTGGGAELTVTRIDLGGLWDDVDDPGRAEPVPSEAVIQQRMGKLNKAICWYMGRPDVIALTGIESKRALDRFLAFVNQIAPDFRDGCLGEYIAFTAEGTAADGLDLGLLLRVKFEDPRPNIVLRSATVLGTKATLTAPDGSKSPLFARPPQLYVIRNRGFDTTRYADVTVLNVDIEAYAKLSSFAPAGHGWQTVRNEATIRRREQARWLANWVQARQHTYPAEALVVVGGFEANTTGDGRVDVLGAIAGHELPESQVLWPVGTKVSPALIEIEDSNGEKWNPTAIVDGNRIRLDHFLVSEGLLARAPVYSLEWINKLNIGYPATWHSLPGYPFGFSTREPVIARMLLPELLYSDLEISFGLPPLATPKAMLERDVRVFNHGPTDAYLSELIIDSTLPPKSYRIEDYDDAPYAWWDCLPTVATATGSRTVCEAYYLGGSPYSHVTGTSYVTIVVPPSDALEDVVAEFVTTVRTAFSEREYRNDSKRATVRFSSDVDLRMKAYPAGTTVSPGENVQFGFGIDNTSGNPPGEVTLVLVVSSPVSKTTVDFSHGTATCTAVDIAAGSRWTCRGTAGDVQDILYGWVSVATATTDAGRLVTLDARVASAVEDHDIENNQATTSTRLGGDLFDAGTVVTAKAPIPAGATSAVPVATFFTGTPPSPAPMRLRVTATSAQPLQSVQFAPAGWTCVRGGTATAVAFDCTAATGTPPSASTLSLRLWPKFTQGGTDRVIVRAEYSHPLAGDSNPWNNVGQAVVTIAPATTTTTGTGTGTAPASAPTPTAPAPAPRTGEMLHRE